jgi:hypothetical protein
MGNQEERDWIALAGIVRRLGKQNVAKRMLGMPNERPKKRDGRERRVTDFEAYHLMEKALAGLVAEGADERKAHRAAARLVADETGLTAGVVVQKHRKVARTFTEEERRSYRQSLSMTKP